MKHQGRPICKMCGIADDGAGGLVIYAPVETTNFIELIQPAELDKMLAAFGAPRRQKAGVWRRMANWARRLTGKAIGS